MLKFLQYNMHTVSGKLRAGQNAVAVVIFHEIGVVQNSGSASDYTGDECLSPQVQALLRIRLWRRDFG